MSDPNKPYLYCMKCRKCVLEDKVKILEVRENGKVVVDFVCPICDTEKQSLRFDKETANGYGGVNE